MRIGFMTETKLQPATRIRKIITRGARWMMGLLYLVCTGVLPAQTPFNATSTTPDAELEQHFHSPPASARPWVFWMWLHTDTTREAITRDLEEMHAKGIAGVILYDSGPGTAMKASAKMELRGKGYEVVPTKDFSNAHITKIPGEQLATWSPRSRELFRHVAKEAGRLGVKFCLTVGLAGTSGAIAAEYGQQKLMWSETEVVGPIDFDVVVPGPATDVPATYGTGSFAGTHYSRTVTWWEQTPAFNAYVGRCSYMDISRAARAGANDLEITVVNLWPNRMIGDASLPEENRLTETNLHKFSAATPLYPSGLLGPVEVFQSEVTINESNQ